MKWLTTILAALALALIAATGRTGETTAEILRAAPCDGPKADVHALAQAVERATTDRRIRALVIAVGRFESGGWRPDVCDGTKTGDRGKAFGCWQSWHRDRSGGYDGQAKRAARHLRWALSECGTAEGAVALYATGNSCRWSGAKERAEYAARIEARLPW